MAFDKDYYQILEINRNATTTDIKRAYRALVRKYHPDTNPGIEESKIKNINEAYEVLGIPVKKLEFDKVVNIIFPKKTNNFVRREVLWVGLWGDSKESASKALDLYFDPDSKKIYLEKEWDYSKKTFRPNNQNIFIKGGSLHKGMLFEIDFDGPIPVLFTPDGSTPILFDYDESTLISFGKFECFEELEIGEWSKEREKKLDLFCQSNNDLPIRFNAEVKNSNEGYRYRLTLEKLKI
jgi:curved DNA-binding protein CbpA